MKLRNAALLCALACLPLPQAPAQTVLVLPYVQPGDGRTLTGHDVKVLHWLTDQTPGDFAVDVQVDGGPVRNVKVVRNSLDFLAAKKGTVQPEKKKDAEDPEAQPKKTDKTKDTIEPRLPLPPDRDQHYFKYTAHVDHLPFNADVRYRVRLGARLIREATFRTRATADRSVHCVLVGDMAYGARSERTVAYQISQHKPEFLVALGDIVYPTGRVSQYMHYFWRTYNNVSEPGPTTGAPLMASVPFYPVLGNHDIGAKLSSTPDALAAYHFFSPPKGGPGAGPWTTPLGTDEKAAARFRAATPDSYPNLDAYSFDYGPAHFVVINDNRSLAINAPEFTKWLRADLNATAAKWKFVCFHVPGFHSSWTHYPEQQARRLQPIFEETGVDITFAGHVHNYQRTVPLRFTPTKKYKKSLVDGKFTLDRAFDGLKNTRPAGVIHVVAGGGGARLYGPGLDKTALWLKEYYVDNYVEYTARMVADQHSFVTLDIAPTRLELRAFGAAGAEIDRITLTK